MQYVFSALGLLSRLSLFVVVTPTESHKPGDAPSTSYNVTARDLMTPDEIMQIPPHVELLRVQGKPVIIARKLRYFADKEFDGLYPSPDAQPANHKSER